MVVALLIAATQPQLDTPVRAFWLKVAVGNWVPADSAAFATERPIQASLAPLLAILLNNGWIIVLLGGLWAVLSIERRRRMRLAHAFALRNADAMVNLMRTFGDQPNARQRIERSFTEAEAKWKRRLIDVYGEEDAERILEIVNDPDAIEALERPESA